MPITNASLSLPAEVSQEIVSNAIQESAVMQLARQVALPGHGAAIPVITGDPTAYFVDEGQVKTNTDAKLETKTMKGRTIAIIEPFSNQFRDDSSELYDELVARLPMLLAQRFDEQVFHGDAVTGFDTLKDAAAVSLDADAWAGLVTCRETVEATHVETVEGNTSGGSAVVDNGGGVARKTYTIGNPRILGYGHPSYDRAGETEEEEGFDVAKLPNVKYGTDGESAKAVQAILKAKYGRKLTVDGKFGSNSQKQLKAVQKQLGLAQDGVCGENTWRAMLL